MTSPCSTESMGDSSVNMAGTDTSGGGSGVTSPGLVGAAPSSVPPRHSISPPSLAPTVGGHGLYASSFPGLGFRGGLGLTGAAVLNGLDSLLTSTPAELRLQTDKPTAGETPSPPPAAQTSKCPLCTEPFVEPKVLACFHSFCKPCLQRALESADKIICPTCHSETQLCADLGVDSLLNDYGFVNMQKQTEAAGSALMFGSPASSAGSPIPTEGGSGASDSPVAPTCTGCKSTESAASAYCLDCSNFLCANCVMAHQYMHCFEGHRVQELSDMDRRSVNALASTSGERSVKCFRHRAETLRYFCFSCNIPVCRECTTVDHPRASHNFEPMHEVAEKQLEQMQRLLGEARSKQKQLLQTFQVVDGVTTRLQETFAKSQADVDDTARALNKLVEEHRQVALREIQNLYSVRQMQLTLIDKKLQQMTDKLTQTVEFTNRLLRFASISEVMVFKRLLETRLQVIFNYQPDLQSLATLADIEFAPANPHTIKSSVVTAFGCVRGSAATEQTGAKKSSSLAPGGSVVGQSRAATHRLPAPYLPLPQPSALSPSGAPLPIPTLVNGVAQPPMHAFSDSNLLAARHDLGGSSQSLGTFSTFSEPQGAPSQPFPYEKWSSGGADIYANVASLGGFPPASNFAPLDAPFGFGGAQQNDSAQVVELSNRMAAMLPPRSQIKRLKMIYHCKFGEFGVMEGQFTEPSGVAVNAQGDVIVADTNNHRIQVFDKEGRFKFQFGECGKRDSQLLYPNRVAVNRATGDIIVTERSPTHQIQVYNQYGQFLRKFGANVLQHPRGVCVDSRGRVVVVECKVMRVLIFDMYGNVLQKFSCSRYLEFPNGVCANDKQELFISDNRAHCVKVFSYDGQFLRQLGGEGVTNYPIGVGINPLGEVVVADNHNNFNLTVFQQDGTLVNALESKVKHAQCFDVAVVDDGSVVLASKDYRLYLYRYMAPQPPSHL